MKQSAPDISDPSLLWQPIDQSGLDKSDLLYAWLSDTGSLTKRLKQASEDNFELDLVSEQWQSELPNEVRSLFGPVSLSHKFWSRKVCLKGRGEPWVKAHTLIPEHSLLSPLKTVMELNAQPLGEYLFNHPQLLRSGLDVTLLGRDTWGRRSLFYLFGKPILVAEFFLPALLEKSL